MHRPQTAHTHTHIHSYTVTNTCKNHSLTAYWGLQPKWRWRMFCIPFGVCVCVWLLESRLNILAAEDVRFR